MNKFYGIVGVIGGWVSSYRTGSCVEVNVNKQWCKATVVDSGQGKRNVTVIVDDESLALLKVVP
jgi:hypothetical protein